MPHEHVPDPLQVLRLKLADLTRHLAETEKLLANATTWEEMESFAEDGTRAVGEVKRILRDFRALVGKYRRHQSNRITLELSRARFSTEAQAG
jgi:hypothetical protein